MWEDIRNGGINCSECEDLPCNLTFGYVSGQGDMQSNIALTTALSVSTGQPPAPADSSTSELTPPQPTLIPTITTSMVCHILVLESTIHNTASQATTGYLTEVCLTFPRRCVTSMKTKDRKLVICRKLASIINIA